MRLLIILSLMLGLAVSEASAATSTRGEILQLQTRLGLGGGITIAGEPLLATAALARFYHQRDYRPAWHHPANVEALLGWIDDAPSHGLLPGDYHRQALNTLMAQFEHRPPHLWQDPGAQAQLDHLLTDALLIYWSHRHKGRLGPSRQGWQWSRMDLVSPRWLTEVQLHLDNGTLGQVMGLWLPSSKEYRQSRRALSQLLQQRASLPRLGTFPVLGPWERHPRLPDVRRRLHGLGYPLDDLTNPVVDRPLIEALKRFQTDQGLQPDAILGRGTLNALAEPHRRPIEALTRHLERLRWHLSLPDRLEVRWPTGDSQLFLAGESRWTGAGRWEGISRPVAGIANGQWQAQITFLVVNPGRSAPQVSNSTPGQGVALALSVTGDGGMTLFGGQWPDRPRQPSFNWNAPLSLVQHLLKERGNWSLSSLERSLALGGERALPLAAPLPLVISYRTLRWGADGELQLLPDPWGQDAALDRALSRPLFGKN